MMDSTEDIRGASSGNRVHSSSANLLNFDICLPKERSRAVTRAAGSIAETGGLCSRRGVSFCSPLRGDIVDFGPLRRGGVDFGSLRGGSVAGFGSIRRRGRNFGWGRTGIWLALPTGIHRGVGPCVDPSQVWVLPPSNVIGGAPGRCLGFYAVGYIEDIWKRVRIGQLSACRPSLLPHHLHGRSI